MELLHANYINTTTQIGVQSNTALAANIMNPDITRAYFSNGYNSDSTTTTLTISFSVTTTISRIALIEHNLKSFLIYYNGATANTFSLTGPTTTSNFTTNSLTSHYLQVTGSAVNVTSVSIDMKSTIVSNGEKSIGFLALSSVELDFSHIPNSDGYTPIVEPKQIVHQMSDGGTRVLNVLEKKKAKLKLEYVTESFRDSLRSIYDQDTSYLFVPFGTHTSWDQIIFEAVWVGPFDFYKYADDNSGAGFSGQIDLRETPA